MQIKNYTSGIAVETTIARIEQKLAAIGATGIMKLFSPDKKVSSLVFQMPDGNRKFNIKVPANVKACFDAMWKDHCIHTRQQREGTKARILDQAERTAWKLVQDWIEVQVSMIVMKQAESLEVFMPYIWDGRQTYFEYSRAQQFKALPEASTAA